MSPLMRRLLEDLDINAEGQIALFPHALALLSKNDIEYFLLVCMASRG